MNAILAEDIEQSIATQTTLRLIVDITPALIHTGLPYSHPGYFHKSWLDLRS
jgi:hypothetical protein